MLLGRQPALLPQAVLACRAPVSPVLPTFPTLEESIQQAGAIGGALGSGDPTLQAAAAGAATALALSGTGIPLLVAPEATAEGESVMHLLGSLAFTLGTTTARPHNRAALALPNRCFSCCKCCCRDAAASLEGIKKVAYLRSTKTNEGVPSQTAQKSQRTLLSQARLWTRRELFQTKTLYQRERQHYLVRELLRLRACFPTAFLLAAAVLFL